MPPSQQYCHMHPSVGDRPQQLETCTLKVAQQAPDSSAGLRNLQAAQLLSDRVLKPTQAQGILGCCEETLCDVKEESKELAVEKFTWTRAKGWVFQTGLLPLG